MVILGIDPGIATTGYGVCRKDKDKFYYLDCGVIETAKGQPVELRIRHVHDSVKKLIEKFSPDAMAIEELFFANNQKTVINVAQARGVILLAAQECGIPIFEYTPLQVKQSVTGYGKAVKKQVQEMTTRILKLPEIPKPDDTADALAIAICHAHSYNSQLSNYR